MERGYSSFDAFSGLFTYFLALFMVDMAVFWMNIAVISMSLFIQNKFSSFCLYWKMATRLFVYSYPHSYHLFPYEFEKRNMTKCTKRKIP